MPNLALLPGMKAVQTYARGYLGAHAATAGHAADGAALAELLNAAMATELVSMLRYRRHYFMARGPHSQSIAQIFLEHANAALSNTDRLAARIVALGGAPDFSPDGLTTRSRAEYVDGHTLSGMIRDNMLAKQLAIENYHGLIQYLGNREPTTRVLLEDILAVQERHSDELAEQVIALHVRRNVPWPASPGMVGLAVA